MTQRTLQLSMPSEQRPLAECAGALPGEGPGHEGHASRPGDAVKQAGLARSAVAARSSVPVDRLLPSARQKNLPDDDNMIGRCKAYRDGVAQVLGIDDKGFRGFPFVHD